MPELPAAFARRWTDGTGHELAVETVAIDDLLAAVAARMAGPVLHVGARAQVIDGPAGRWQRLLAGRSVIGLDVEPGPGVDAVADIAGDLASLRRKIGAKTVGAVVCCHVLEHVARPWDAARNLQHLLQPGGIIVITVPWVQGWHGFPTDHWRMSFSALRLLFERVAVETEWYSGAREDVGYRLRRDGVPAHGPETLQHERNLLQLMLPDAPAQRAFDDREGDKLPLSRLYMPACAVNMVGVRR
ncbi:MAG: methyltransferase domain-containing protein [Alphaproteobacteria bacterium]|nr:methyltransferase domain-containing protein [Alphaproteobacteria bacterium]